MIPIVAAGIVPEDLPSSHLDSPSGTSFTSDDSSVDIDLSDLIEASTPTRSSPRSHGTSTSISSRAQLGVSGDRKHQQSVSWADDKAGGQLEAPPARHRQASSLSTPRVHIRAPSSQSAIAGRRHRKSSSLYSGLYDRTLSGFLLRSYRRASLGERLLKLLILACVLVGASALLSMGSGGKSAPSPVQLRRSRPPPRHYVSEQAVIPPQHLAIMSEVQEAGRQYQEAAAAQQQREAHLAAREQEYLHSALELEQHEEMAEEVAIPLKQKKQESKAKTEERASTAGEVKQPQPQQEEAVERSWIEREQRDERAQEEIVITKPEAAEAEEEEEEIHIERMRRPAVPLPAAARRKVMAARRIQPVA